MHACHGWRSLYDSNKCTWILNGWVKGCWMLKRCDKSLDSTLRNIGWVLIILRIQGLFLIFESSSFFKNMLLGLVAWKKFGVVTLETIHWHEPWGVAHLVRVCFPIITNSSPLRAIGGFTWSLTSGSNRINWGVHKLT